MTHINLLPFRAQRSRENIHRQIIIFSLVFVLSFAGLFYVNMLLNGKIEDLEEEVSQARSELARVQRIAAKVDNIKKELDILNKKMEIIAEIEANRSGPVRLLEMMTRAVVPQKMWFESLIDTDQGLRITGIALDQETVAEFMKNLEIFSSRYRLTDKSITALKNEKDFPSNILEKLEELKDKDYSEEKEFLASLESVIGRDYVSEYKALIIKNVHYKIFERISINSINQQKIKEDNLKKFDVAGIKPQKETESDDKKKKK